MIKVQTLRLRGLCASSLLALAACSGTPTDFVDVQTGSSEGTPLTGTPLTTSTTLDDVTTSPQDPQDPQGRAAIVKRAVANARRSLDLRLFEDARSEAAYALELDAITLAFTLAAVYVVLFDVTALDERLQ